MRIFHEKNNLYYSMLSACHSSILVQYTKVTVSTGMYNLSLFKLMEFSIKLHTIKSEEGPYYVLRTHRL